MSNKPAYAAIHRAAGEYADLVMNGLPRAITPGTRAIQRDIWAYAHSGFIAGALFGHKRATKRKPKP